MKLNIIFEKVNCTHRNTKKYVWYWQDYEDMWMILGTNIDPFAGILKDLVNILKLLISWKEYQEMCFIF